MPKPSQAVPSSGSVLRRRHRIVVGVLALVAAALLGILAPPIGGSLSRQLASQRITECRFGAAQRWLAWSARLDPGDYHTDLLTAACQRYLQQHTPWREALDAAERKGAPAESITLEIKLDRLQSGELHEGAEGEIGDLGMAGASVHDIATVFVRGYLARDHAGKAKVVLDWAFEILPDEAHVDYLWGLYWHKQGDLAEAETRLRRCLDARPDHELARTALAELYQAKGRLDLALAEYAELGTRSGAGDAAAVGVAGVLRKLARLDEARWLLAPRASLPEPTPAVRAEMARIEVESGNYPEAERWIRRLPADKSIEETVLFPAIIALALQGNGTAAERLFDTATESWDRSWWLFDLRVRLANNPEDRAAAQEIQRLTRLSSPQSLQELIGVRQPKEQGPRAGSATSVAELYKVHCRACHGTGGDGHGPAARNLFPRPRNLRSGKSQLVSTRNGVPTLEDLQRMLAQGMPGTSMAAFDKLPAADRRLLAEEVLRLRREGIQEEVARALQQEGEEIDRAELRQTVERLTTPGERVRLPGDWPALQQAAERGKVSYRTLGCNKCHGDDGIGAADQPLFDEQGEPARARDLVHEPFKGGRDLESVYLRIAAGMPGTAHPAAWNLPQDQVTEVAAFVRSLARGPERMLTNFERRMRSASRAYLAWINQSSGESPEAGEKHVLVPAGRIDQEHP